MNRRQVLEAGCGALAALLAGCAADGDADGSPSPGTVRGGDGSATPSASPPPEPTAAATATSTGKPTGTPVASYRDAFAGFLEARDPTVEELRAHPSEGTVELRYTTNRSGYQELGAEIGMISGGFFRQVARGWEMSRLNATILRSDGAPAATWYARTEWFREFQEEEITANELSLRILETLEPVDE